MLTEHGYFDAWLKVEKDFALARYKTIRDSPESNELDFDSTPSGTTKPTKGAIRVNDLLATITDRYRSLSSFSDKLKFLIDVQLAIFDDYFSHLHGGLEAFLMSSHKAGRFIQGQSISDTDTTTGLRGLESLCKIYGSAEYLERKMSDWSDDVFFLELWDELENRARRNAGANGSVGRGLNTMEVASKTSASIKGNADDGEDAMSGGGLFDETASSYRRLRERAEAEIVRLLESNINGAMRQFSRSSGWSSLSATTTDPASLSPSTSLDVALQVISAQLGYLAGVLATAPLRRITRQVCLTIQRDIHDGVLLRNYFSTSGVAQLRCDITALEEVVDATIKGPRRSQTRNEQARRGPRPARPPLRELESRRREGGRMRTRTAKRKRGASTTKERTVEITRRQQRGLWRNRTTRTEHGPCLKSSAASSRTTRRHERSSLRWGWTILARGTLGRCWRGGLRGSRILMISLVE